MEKKRVIKSDGRYLIFYGFKRPLPEVYPDQAKEAGGPAGPHGQGEGSGAPAGPER